MDATRVGGSNFSSHLPVTILNLISSQPRTLKSVCSINAGFFLLTGQLLCTFNNERETILAYGLHIDVICFMYSCFMFYVSYA